MRRLALRLDYADEGLLLRRLVDLGAGRQCAFEASTRTCLPAPWERHRPPYRTILKPTFQWSAAVMLVLYCTVVSVGRSDAQRTAEA